MALLNFNFESQASRSRKIAEEQSAYDLAKSRADAILEQQAQQYGRAAAALNLKAPDIGSVVQMARVDPAQASNMLNQAGLQRNPQAQLAMQDRRQGMAQAAAQEGRAAGLYPGQQQLQGQQIASNTLSLAKARQEAAAPPPLPPSPAQVDRQIYERDTGTIMPKEFRPVRRFAPDGQGGVVQFVDAQPLEQTPAWNEADKEVKLRESMVQTTEDFLDLLSTSGTELRGPQALKMREARRRILGDYAELLRLGVLQRGEMENLEEILPDPTSWGLQQLNPAAAGNIAQVYEQLNQQWANRLKETRQRHWFIAPQRVLPEDQ